MNKAFHPFIFLFLGLVSFSLRAQQTDEDPAAGIEGQYVGIQFSHASFSAFDVELADKQWLNAEVSTLTFDVIRYKNKPSVWSALLDKTQEYQVLYNDTEQSVIVAMNLINPHLNPTFDLKKTIRVIRRLKHPFGEEMLRSLHMVYAKLYRLADR